MIRLVTESQKASPHFEKGAGVFSQYCVCYGQEANLCRRPVMTFPGLFPRRGTDILKTNTGHRNLALVSDNGLAKIQSL